MAKLLMASLSSATPTPKLILLSCMTVDPNLDVILEKEVGLGRAHISHEKGYLTPLSFQFPFCPGGEGYLEGPHRGIHFLGA